MFAMGQKQTHATQQTASYSITSSARPSSVDGTTSPSSFAALRFDDKLELRRLLDWISPGFVPTLSTMPAAPAIRQSAIVWLDTSSRSHFTSTLRPASWLFGRPTTRRWEKLPCRIAASDRDGRSDPIARCAHYYNTIAERRSDSTTGCGRVLS